MREIRTLRARRRELETEPRTGLNGHAGGNPGYSQASVLTGHRASSRPYLFRRRRRALEQRFRPRTDGKPFERRVRELAEVLTECGYMAEVEKAGREFLLTEHNCAIRNVAACFPEACEEELILIENLAGGEVSRVTHLLAGDSHCSYRIRRGGRANRTPRRPGGAEDAV